MVMHLPESDTCPFPELCSANDGLFMSIPYKSLQKKEQQQTTNK